MHIEMHQFELRYASLRVQDPGRRARLLASVARYGQRSQVLVTPKADERYVLIDGYARVDVLRELGRDLAEALVLDLDEDDALVFAHRLEAKRRRSALEEGWLIAELVERHGLDQRQIAERLQRSVSWVSRRLGLVTRLPRVAQDAVRRGIVPPQSAMKYLLPLSRDKRAECVQLVQALGDEPVTVRELERIYLLWKRADPDRRARIVRQPRMALKADDALRPEPAVPAGDPAAPLLNDLDGISGIARRARRRVREGVLHELDVRRRKLVARSCAEARLAVQTLTGLLEEESSCSTTTPAPPS